MNKSLSTRLMYNFMAIIIVIVVGVTAGISYLISDYFFKLKEQELAEKGAEMAETIEYFVRRDDHDMLFRYIIAVDKLVGARIWLFNNKYELIAASSIVSKETDAEWPLLEFFSRGDQTYRTADTTVTIDREMNKREISDKVKVVLDDVYAGKSYKSQLFHPYYKEQVILVGVPYYDRVSNRSGAILMTEPQSGFSKFLSTIYIFIVLIAIAAIIMSLFMVRRLSGLISQPLLKMKDVATAMASGDYSRRVEVKGSDEVADLGHALNSLGDDLGAYVAKMERTEKIRRDFVANVSHELRTPITIIRGYNEAIYDGMVTDPDVLLRYRGLINEETIRLERMVRELLDISRLQAADALTVNNMDELPLAAIIRNVAEKLMVNSSKHHVKFDIQADDTIRIMGNGDQLVQLVLILSDNALKYSPENGTVSLGAKKMADGTVVMTVKDEGPGIPEEDIPFIWERFYKVDKSHCRNVPGTGLGLAIAKEIIRMHGASAEVISKCGEGTTFEIKFPKDKVV